jgi:hypothetical protein
MQPDFSDIRFTYYNQSTSSETEIPYWLENQSNSNWAIVWVKVPFIRASTYGKEIIYIYYKNTTTVTSKSSIDDAFLLGDEFTGASINTTKWTAQTGCSVTGGLLKCSGNGVDWTQGYITSVQTFQRGIRTEMLIMRPNGWNSGTPFNFDYASVWNGVNTTKVYGYDTANGGFVIRYSNGTNYNNATGIGAINSVWYYVSITINASHISNGLGVCNNTTCTYGISQYPKYYNATIDDQLYDTNKKVSIGTTTSSTYDYLYVDKIFVRNFQLPEPTSTVGSEEIYLNAIYFNYNSTIPDTNQTYPVASVEFRISVNSSDTIDSVWINHNITGTFANYLMSNLTPKTPNTWINYTYTFYNPPAGYFAYTFYANTTSGNSNNTITYYYLINKAPTTIHLAINGSEADATYIYYNYTNTTGWKTVANGSLYLYRNSTLINSTTTGNVLSDVWRPPAGYYNYTLVLNHQNYTAPSVTRFLNITQRNAGIALTSSAGWNVFQGQNVEINCTYNEYTPTPVVKKDGITISVPYSFVTEFRNYVFTCNMSDTQNYTNTYDIKELVVNPLLACTSNTTFAFSQNFTTGTYTYNVTNLVRDGLVRSDLGDFYCQYCNIYTYISGGSYYITLENTTGSFTLYFGNYYNNISHLSNTATSSNTLSNYTQINSYVIYNILDELTGNYLYPPNSTLTSIISCSSGENYIPISNGTTRFLVATMENTVKATIRVTYSEGVYYSRQLYPPNATSNILNFYVADAYQNPLDRVVFNMLDPTHYNDMLIIYVPLGNSEIIITEGYFDASHQFSCYLIEDLDYYLRLSDGTELGRATITEPSTRDLGRVTINFNPSTLSIYNSLILNAYICGDQICVDYNDSSAGTRNITVSIYFENETLYINQTFTNQSVLNLNYDIPENYTGNFIVRFSIYHSTLNSGNEITYTIITPRGFEWTLGMPSIYLTLASLTLLVLVAGLGTQQNLIGTTILLDLFYLLLVGIGWLSFSGGLFGIILISSIFLIIYLMGMRE